MRGDPEADRARERWRRFLAAHAEGLREAGIESGALTSPDVWTELFCRGEITGADGRTRRLAELDEAAYAALVRALDSWFSVGYEFFDPLALRAPDRDWLAARHAG